MKETAHEREPPGPHRRPIRDAVTALLQHGEQLCLVRRHPALAAFPGYDAFPGGKVDETDTNLPLRLDAFSGQDPRLTRALVRELQEELHFDLLQAAREGTVAGIHCLGQITTPTWAPVRFRTWFFRVELTTQPTLEPDGRECIAADMQPVSVWLRRYRAGRLLLAPPTLLALQALEADPKLASLPPFPDDPEDPGLVPWIEPLGGLRMLLVRSNTLPPARHTNAFWFGGGPAPRVLVDPSPSDRDELQRLCQRLDTWGVDQVFLTHHHADHREYADEIARRYNALLGMSADTRQRIAERSGQSFFSGLQVRIYSEGDALSHWQGEPVRLLAVPGHDEGQLAPMPESRAWCIVSDLIQGVGTVVIAPPEGHMARYFATLRRVIEHDPAVILPSHGMALGTTHYLRQALAHREQRERQVLTLHRAGHGEDAMLEAIYKMVDPRLLPLARVNIRSHLQKLREEGQLDQESG